MTASEIAEQMFNGNIADARHEILCWDEDVRDNSDATATVVKALEVVNELALMISYPPDYQTALKRVRRCLTGGS
jgi:hypothetical protein